jgi:hypothetical protein
MNAMNQRFNYCPTDKWADMVFWCERNLGARGHKWHHRYPDFFFMDEQACVWFRLKWS